MDEAPRLLHPIGFGLHRRTQLCVNGFGRHVDGIAVHIELPAMIKTAQAALLVPSERKRSTAMGTCFLERADPATGIAKNDNVLPQQPHAER